MRSKDSCPVRGEAVGKVPEGNSLAAYSTARPVLRGRGGSNAVLLPDQALETKARFISQNVVKLLMWRPT